MFSILTEWQAEEGWLEPFIEDFHKRFIHLLGYGFRHFDPSLVLSVLEPKGVAGRKADADMDKKGKGVSVEELERTFTGTTTRSLWAVPVILGFCFVLLLHCIACTYNALSSL